MRYNNGHVDTGKRIQTNLKCWNCGSSEYYQTVSIEHCPSCGIRCDYCGSGVNEKYESASNAKHQREEYEREERLRKELEQEREWFYYDECD